jgi:hypothetical protein
MIIGEQQGCYPHRSSIYNTNDSGNSQILFKRFSDNSGRLR